MRAENMMRTQAISYGKPPIKKFMRKPDVIISCGNKPTKPTEILLQGKQPKSSINYFA